MEFCERCAGQKCQILDGKLLYENMQTDREAVEGRRVCAAMKRPQINGPWTSAATRGSKYFRRLKWDELVVQGDFVANERQGFELWEGPGGFRADAFLRPIYRRVKRRSTTAGKPR